MKKKYIQIILLITLFCIVLSCQNKIVSDCVEESSFPDQKVTFNDIQINVFNSSCISCHSGSLPAGELDLSEGVAYDNLVNISSITSNYKRVVPFNAEQSYLFLVLEGGETQVMPPDGKLSAATIDSVASWINRGAIKE